MKELSEQDVEEEVELFRLKLEKLYKEGSKYKRKMKPNISMDWIKELRKRLQSLSTTENSVEREKV